MNGERHPGDCLCSECTADSIYEYWLDEEYIEARCEAEQAIEQ